MVMFDGQIHPDLPGRYGDCQKTSPGNLRDNLITIGIYCMFVSPRKHSGFMVDVSEI